MELYNNRHTPCGCVIIVLTGVGFFLSLLSYLLALKAAQAHAGQPLPIIREEMSQISKLIE